MSSIRLTANQMENDLRRLSETLNQLLTAVPIPTTDCEIGLERQLYVNRAIASARDTIMHAHAKLIAHLHEDDD